MNESKVIKDCTKFEETLANLIEHQRVGERKFLSTRAGAALPYKWQLDQQSLVSLDRLDTKGDLNVSSLHQSSHL